MNCEVPSLFVCLSPTDAPDAVHRIEVGVAAQDGKRVLPCKGRNPEIVGGNRAAFGAKNMKDLRKVDALCPAPSAARSTWRSKSSGISRIAGMGHLPVTVKRYAN